MILTKEVTISINVNNIKHLKELGYENLKIGEYLTIPVDHLSAGSGCEIQVMCDICEKIKYLSYTRYLLSFNNGGYYACSNKCNFEKKKNKFLCDGSREKTKLIKKEKYGDPYYNNHDKYKETCLDRYGVENCFQSEELKEKIKRTNLILYGVDNPSKSDEIKKKKEKTSLKNNGVKYHLQNGDDYEKCFKKALRIKKYKDTNLNYQGSYEFDFLEYCEINNILNHIRNYRIGIKYEIDGRNRIYFPDFYIEEFNLIIEIKSTYTYNFHLEMNRLKKESCLNLGYNYILIIDKKYDIFTKDYTSIL